MASCAGLCKLDPLSLDPTCEGYTPVRNSKGRDVLIGNVAWEGFLSSKAPASPHALTCHAMNNGIEEQSQCLQLHASVITKLPVMSWSLTWIDLWRREARGACLNRHALPAPDPAGRGLCALPVRRVQHQGHDYCSQGQSH